MTTLNLFLACTFLACSLSIHAQEKTFSEDGKRGVRIGVTAGMNVSSPTNEDTKVGYQLGLRGEWYFKSPESGPFVSFGAMLSEKPYKQKYYVLALPSDPMPREWSKVGHPTFVEVPVHFGWRWKVGDKLNLFASAGLYANIGVFGKERTKSKAFGATPAAKYTTNIFGDYGNQAFCDYGVGYRVGMDIARHYQVSLSQDWGIRDMNELGYGTKFKNRNFSLSFTYMF